MTARCTAKCVIENGRCKYCGSTQLEILATGDTCLRSDLHPVGTAYLHDKTGRKAMCFWCHKDFPYPYEGTAEERAEALTAHTMECQSHPMHQLTAVKTELAAAERHLTITNCTVCHGSGEFVDSDSGGFIAKCHCWQNLVNNLRKAYQDLAHASLKLCEWAPDCSQGSIGYERKEKVKTLASAAISGKNPVNRSQLQELQSVVVDWATLAFTHKQMTDPKVRALRLLEEAAEFAQAVGVDFQQMRALVNYVYARPKGDPAQELGGVGITWLAAAHSINTTAEKCLEDEIERVKSKPIGEFTARNQTKVDAGFGPAVHMFGHTYETRNKKYEIDEVMALILFEAVLTGSLQKATNCFAEGIAAGRIKEVDKGDE